MNVFIALKGTHFLILFAKAFKSITWQKPHQRLLKKLLKKLSGYGIKGKIYTWIKEFMSNRRQRVAINGVFSEWKNVTSGIPHGSVLGPIIFIIFINDMPEVLNFCAKFFADDAKVYSTIKEEIIESGCKSVAIMLKNGPKYGICSSTSETTIQPSTTLCH